MSLEENTNFKTTDYILIAIISFLLIITWCYVIIYYKYLPETIAVHFDVNGQPNGYNSKNSIWLAPILFTLLSIGCVFGAKYPQKVTFPYRKLNFVEKKATSKIMIFSAILLNSILLIICLSMIKVSLEKNFATKWILPSIIILTLLYLVVIIYYQLKIKRK